MAAKPRSRKRQPVDPHRALRDPVRELLPGGHAHLVFKDAIADWPTALRGAKPAGQPFTPWRLLEHTRITQRDIVEFTTRATHVSPQWPAGHRPPTDAPPDDAASDPTLAQAERARRATARLLSDAGPDR